MIDLLLILILGAVTWCVASEGAWGAALVFLSVLLSGLLAMNFFEPTAEFLQRNVSSSTFMRNAWDFIALVGLFALFVWLLRSATDHLSPRFIHLHPLLYQFSRWTCAGLAGFVTMAFLMTALHTAPLPREFAGFRPEVDRRTTPLAQMGPDYLWLGFTQYVSETSLQKGQKRIFDGRREQFGDYPQQVWSSFPMRYAHRREAPDRAASIPSGGAAQPGVPRPGGTPGGRRTNF